MQKLDTLKHHHRTFDPNIRRHGKHGKHSKHTKQDRLMVFTKNESKGYRSMKECLNHYEFQKYAQEDYVYRDKFDIDEKKFVNLFVEGYGLHQFRNEYS